MKKTLKVRNLAFSLMVALVLALPFSLALGGNAFAVDCSAAELKALRDNTFLGLPPWYKYLPAEEVKIVDINNPDPTGAGKSVCQPVIRAIQDVDGHQETIPVTNILLIIAAVLEILIRVAGIAAFIYLIYGGFMYMTSSGNSDNTKKAGATLLNAAIGLAIAISATTIVQFFAGRLSK